MPDGVKMQTLYETDQKLEVLLSQSMYDQLKLIFEEMTKKEKQ